MDNRRVKFCLKNLCRFRKIIRKPQGGKNFWRTLYIKTTTKDLNKNHLNKNHLMTSVLLGRAGNIARATVCIC